MAMSHSGLFSLFQCAYFGNREQQKTNIIMSSHSTIIRLSKIENTLTQPSTGSDFMFSCSGYRVWSWICDSG